MMKSRREIKFIIVTIAIMAFIFIQSALPADLSGAESNVIVEFVANILHRDPQELSFAVRKCAHFTEYLVLGISLVLTVKNVKLRLNERAGDPAVVQRESALGSGDESFVESESVTDSRMAVFVQRCLAWLIGTAYAVTDEFHQFFVDGRSCEVRDMCIDSAGVLSGVIVISVIIMLHRYRKLSLHKKDNLKK